MYASNPESKLAVLVTEDRKGNRPMRALLVEIDEALKDGHAAESASDMQDWASAAGRLLASSAPRAHGRLVLRLDRRAKGNSELDSDAAETMMSRE